jgi:hypothetical protein
MPASAFLNMGFASGSCLMWSSWIRHCPRPEFRRQSSPSRRRSRSVRFAMSAVPRTQPGSLPPRRRVTGTLPVPRRGYRRAASDALVGPRESPSRTSWNPGLLAASYLLLSVRELIFQFSARLASRSSPPRTRPPARLLEAIIAPRERDGCNFRVEAVTRQDRDEKSRVVTTPAPGFLPWTVFVQLAAMTHSSRRGRPR